MQHSASSTCSDVNAARVSPEAHHHYPVIQQPIQSNGDFRVPGAPPATSQIVSSSTCTTPSVPGHIIMRPPPPPPPLPLKISRNFVAHQDVKSSHITQEEPSSSIPDLEFDGTTVLCRVCGDKASGFHYGVHSCEGCKGFFRRSIQQKIQYRPCTKNQQCSILRINRNRCQYCRLKKCIAVGMSRDAVRFGRVPKREKARILAAMQQSTNSRSQEKALTAELEDDQRLLATVVRAHLETCDFTRDKVEPMLIRARTQPSFTACPPTLACPLNPNPQPLTGQQELLQDFSKRFSPAIRGVVEFAKRITGFALLPQDDQVTLLKAGVFEVLLVRLACMFDAQNNTMICLNGQVLKRDSIHNSSNARFLMDSMFDFAERLNSLHLSDAEIGLFSSIVVIASDRPGLRNVELIEKMHNKLKALLQTVLAQNHPTQPTLCQELIKKIPDLRTLNTLHSEKLLAFKMTEQQQLQQQHNLWNGSNGAVKYKQEPIDYHRGLDDCGTKSPVGSSSWSSSSEGGAMEEVKSPMGSVSSTESACSGEVAALNENAAAVAAAVSGQAANAPLLAATLAAGVCPMRRRENSIGSMSGDDDATNASLHAHPHLHMKLQQQHHHQMQQHQHHAHQQQHLVSHKSTFPRKLDSPCDSGIESGTEKIEKLTNSAPTSVCSSPRSSLEDKDDHHNSNTHHHSANNQSVNNQQNGGQSIDDMPVLKRVLQAPPLYDTNSLMDEAYKPHKKFRALRNKDTAEAEPIIVVTNGNIGAGSSTHQHQPQQPQLQQQSQSQLQHHLTSSLSSTHSTLAKSLMEGPRMTPEQMKRTDIIHNFIMRGADAMDSSSHHHNHHQQQHQQSSGSSSGSSTSSRCSPNQQIYYVPQPTKWEQNGDLGSAIGTIGVGTSVITSSGRPQVSSSPYLNTVVRSQSLSPHGEPITKIYLRGSNLSPPTCLSSSSSPVHFLHSQSPGLSQSPPMHVQSPIHRQSPMHSHSPPHSNHSPSVSPPAHMMSTVNLQVGITNSQQPLNLSKKTPPSSPRPISASTTTPKIVSLEA